MMFRYFWVSLNDCVDYCSFYKKKSISQHNEWKNGREGPTDASTLHKQLGNIVEISVTD